MADNVSIKDATDATRSIATDDVGGAQVQIVKIGVGGDGVAVPVSTDNPLPVDVGTPSLPEGACTTAKQDAILAAVAGLGDAIAAVTAAVQATGAVSVSNFPETQPVSGTVTVANPVSAVAVSNLPATQPVSGTVAVSNLPTMQAVSGTVTVGNASLAVTGPASNAELRAEALAVSLASAPLPTDAATQTTLAAVLAKLSSDPATQTTLAAMLDAMSRVVSSSSGYAVTPSDSTTTATPPNALWIGTGGDVRAMVGGVALTYKNVPSGSVLPIRPTRIYATGTTATDMVAM